MLERIGSHFGAAFGRIAQNTPPALPMATATFHTYPDLLLDGGRLACTEWPVRCSVSEAVTATIRLDPECIVLRAGHVNGEQVRGLAPGGLG